jgi:hypothetical protein
MSRGLIVTVAACLVVAAGCGDGARQRDARVAGLPDSSWLTLYDRVRIGASPTEVAAQVPGLSASVAASDGAPFDHIDATPKLLGHAVRVQFEYRRDRLCAVAYHAGGLNGFSGDGLMARLSAFYSARLGSAPLDTSADPPWRVLVRRWRTPNGVIEVVYELAEPARFIDWEYRPRRAGEGG